MLKENITNKVNLCIGKISNNKHFFCFQTYENSSNVTLSMSKYFSKHLKPIKILLGWTHTYLCTKCERY